MRQCHAIVANDINDVTLLHCGIKLGSILEQNV